MRTAESSVEDARAANHAISLCYALAHAACPIALLDRRSGRGGTLRGDAARPFDTACAGALARLRPQPSGSARHQARRSRRRIAAAARRLRRTRRRALAGGPSAFLTETAEALGRAGQIADGLAAIEEAIERCEQYRRTLGYCRVAARQGRASSVAGRARSRGGGRGSLPASARLGAPARCPVLGTARRHEPCPAVARSGPEKRGAALLAPIYGRFTEGFDTADLKAAKAVIDELE